MNNYYNRDLATYMKNNLRKIRKKNLRKSFQSFDNNEHRMEFVAEINKVSYINDTKATSSNATYFALKSIQKPIIWIVGGDDKKTNYKELLPLVRLKVQSIIMIGNENSKLYSAFKNETNEIFEVKTINEAVLLAKTLSFKDANILFSPASNPDKKFISIKQRGLLFKKAVLKIR